MEMGLLVQSYLPGPFFPPWASLSCCTNQAEPRHVVSPAKPSVSQTPVPLPTHTHTVPICNCELFYQHPRDLTTSVSITRLPIYSAVL